MTLLTKDGSYEGITEALEAIQMNGSGNQVDMNIQNLSSDSKCVSFCFRLINITTLL